MHKIATDDGAQSLGHERAKKEGEIDIAFAPKAFFICATSMKKKEKRKKAENQEKKKEEKFSISL